MKMITGLLTLYNFFVSSKAALTFENSGRKSGWDETFCEGHGIVTEVDQNCFSSSSSCLKFEQTYDQRYQGRYHCETRSYDAASEGRTSYYGFAFKLADDWEYDDNRVTISQFIANLKDVDCGQHKKEWSPTTMIWVQNVNLYTRIRYGNPCDDNENEKILKLSKVSKGIWHTITLEISWSTESSGKMDVWFDGVQVAHTENIATLPRVSKRQYQFRVGIYPNWFDPLLLEPPKVFIQKGHQKTKVVYIDNISYGPNFAAGDPNDSSWNKKLHPLSDVKK